MTAAQDFVDGRAGIVENAVARHTFELDTRTQESVEERGLILRSIAMSEPRRRVAQARRQHMQLRLLAGDDRLDVLEVVLRLIVMLSST